VSPALDQQNLASQRQRRLRSVGRTDRREAEDWQENLPDGQEGNLIADMIDSRAGMSNRRAEDAKMSRSFPNGVTGPGRALFDYQDLARGGCGFSSHEVDAGLGVQDASTRRVERHPARRQTAYDRRFAFGRLPADVRRSP